MSSDTKSDACRTKTPFHIFQDLWKRQLLQQTSTPRPQYKRSRRERTVALIKAALNARPPPRHPKINENLSLRVWEKDARQGLAVNGS